MIVVYEGASLMGNKDSSPEFPEELTERLKKLDEHVRAHLRKSPKRMYAFLAIRRKMLRKDITSMEYLLELGFTEEEANELITKAD